MVQIHSPRCVLIPMPTVETSGPCVSQRQSSEIFSQGEPSNVGTENAASNSIVLDAIRIQLRPKSGVLAVSFGEEGQ